MAKEKTKKTWWWWTWRIGVGALFVAFILAVWWVAGFELPYRYAQGLDGKLLPSSGQFGDGFNAAATLFAGVALCGTIVALILQQKEISKGDDEREEQLKIAQDTARLQTLSYFSRMQIDAMTGATKDMQKYMGVIAAFYATRTMELMQEMGEDFASISNIIPETGIIQMNCRMGALSILSHIADELASFNDQFTLISQQSGDNSAACLDIVYKAQTLEQWIRDYGWMFPPAEIGYVSTIPQKMRVTASRHHSRSEELHWRQWVSEQAAYPGQIREARSQIEENCKLNKKPMF